MKSIKERAEEKYPIITGELQTYNEKFVEGANYVLSEIEKIINHPRRFVTCDKSVEEGMIEEISKLVEHLKKK